MGTSKKQKSKPAKAKKAWKKAAKANDGFDLNSCCFVPITPENIHKFHKLMNSQAKAHKTVVRGPDGNEVENDNRKQTEDAFFDPEKKILDGFFLKTAQGETVGFVTTSIAHTPEGRVMYLEDIHVLPTFQEKSLGSTLYRAVQMLAWSQKCVEVSCTVDAENESANRFYRLMNATKHGFPVLGMDGFSTMTSVKAPGTVIVISEEDRKKLEEQGLIDKDANTININQDDINEKKLTAAQINGVSLDASKVDIIDLDDVKRLKEYQKIDKHLKRKHKTAWMANEKISKKPFLKALRDILKHERNFCVRSFNEAGETTAISFVKVSFSTFNNIERLNFGSTVSLTGKAPDHNTIMNHIAFCQNLEEGGNKLEVQLDPNIASNPEMETLYDICSSRMTPENPTDEYSWSIKVDPVALSQWFIDLSSSLQKSLTKIAGRRRMDNVLKSAPKVA